MQLVNAVVLNVLHWLLWRSGSPGVKASCSSGVTCNTEFWELAHSITVVLCPAGCWRQHSSLCGSQFYTGGPICLAAMQNQLIDEGGGPVTVYRSPGSSLNKVATQAGARTGSCTAGGSYTFTFEMTCATQGNSSQPVTQVKCPHGCGKDPVYGSEIYSSDSSVCSAAIHAGLITVNGGVVTFYSGKGQTSYTGSTNNSITTLSASASDYSFSFKRFNKCLNTTCQNGGTCVELIGDYACFCPPGFYGKQCKAFTECWNGNLSGLYSYKSGLKVLCDNGWTVMQRRFDGSIDFQQNWTEYKNGFGSFSGEFWWGLEHVYQAVKNYSCSQCRLRINISDFNGTSGYADYSQFLLSNETDKYRICVGGYNGTIGDSMNPPAYSWASCNGTRFSTPDQDNDKTSKVFCAEPSRKKGGGWFNACSHAVLNGAWTPVQPPGERFFAFWASFKNSTPLMTSNMEFRCGLY